MTPDAPILHWRGLNETKKYRTFHPKAVAKAIRPIAEVASSKAVREGRSTDAIISWQNKLKRLEAEDADTFSASADQMFKLRNCENVVVFSHMFVDIFES